MQTFLAQREQFHQSRLVEGLNPLNPNYQVQTADIAARLRGIGIGVGQLDGVQMGNLYQTVLKQAELLSYMDVFWGLTLFVGCVTPLVFLLRTKPPEQEAAR